MTHYIIAIKDGWKPGDCYMCQFKCAPVHGINPKCPLEGARAFLMGLPDREGN
jgi:hypothetical protein